MREGPKPIPISLTASEVLMGAQAGLQRVVQGKLKDGRNDKTGHMDTKVGYWGADIEGALGEMAAARCCNVYWQGKGKLPGPGEKSELDIGGVYNVRWTRHANGRLMIFKKDIEEHPQVPYILVTGGLGEYQVCGWVRAADAERPIWWQDPGNQGRHAYFVDNKMLNPMGEIFP